jgi:hypothetical protein
MKHLIALLLPLWMAAAASATTLSFGTCVSGTNATDCATGSAQFSVTVTSSGANRVDFTFTNSGPLAASITDIYFDDGTLLGIASITNGSGVSFSQGATPGNLPAGNNASPPFVATRASPPTRMRPYRSTESIRASGS